MKLKTERLLLREFEQTDIPILYHFNLAPEVQRFESDTLVTEYQFYQIMQGVIAEQAAQPRLSYYFALIQREDNQLIGSCYVTVQPEQQGEIGYLVGVDYWGQGYATEAARQIIEFGFGKLQLHRIYAEALNENRASIQVLEKVGMRREGVLRENKWFKNRWWDTCIYAVLTNEWKYDG